MKGYTFRNYYYTCYGKKNSIQQKMTKIGTFENIAQI